MSAVIKYYINIYHRTTSTTAIDRRSVGRYKAACQADNTDIVINDLLPLPIFKRPIIKCALKLY